ncbi:MAG: hypothetical protein ACYTET_03575 [Planctomycetota bacterium]|jgi:hypothetical protein
MKTGIVCFVTALLLVTSAVSMAFPAPAKVQNLDQWTLKVKYAQPEQILLEQNGQRQRFWYLIITVTNDAGFEDVSFYPACELMTDTFQMIPAGKKVPSGVFDAIKRKHQGSYPFLESLDFKDHRIFRGADNTRDFAIIWPDIDPKARQVSLFISGLSNETAIIPHPLLKDDTGAPKSIFLQKTLQLKYAIGGDQSLRDTAMLKKIEADWVMR